MDICAVLLYKTFGIPIRSALILNEDMMKFFVRLLLSSSLLLALAGCASVSLRHSAIDSTLPAKHYQKLLIVGIAEKPQMRQIFEEVLAAELEKRGVKGIASYSITGVKETLSRTIVEEAVQKTGADGVITTRMTALKKDSETHTGFIMTDHGFADGYGVHVTYATFVHQPVEVILSTEAVLETNLFDSATGRLVWTGSSSAVDPKSIITVSRELAAAVFKAMAKDGLF